MKQTLIIFLALAILTSCRTSRQSSPSPPSLPVVPIESSTNTKIIHTEIIDTTFVDVPAQSAERTTHSKTSHLETDYAESDARINEDGTLSHTLTNKPGKKPVPVKNNTDTIYIDKAVEIPVPVEIPMEVERELTAWEKSRLNTWGWLATALGLCAG